MATRKYNIWSKEDMEAALQKFKDGSMKFNEVCRFYNIPKPTFRRHLKGLNTHARIGRPKDLLIQMEEELVRHILELESCFFGLTIKDLRKLAYQLAEKYELNHRFNKEKQMAGWKWYYKFIKDHPEISLRAPQPTSMARCKGFNKKNVMDFFDKYEAILDKEKFTASQIFNMDETGLSTVHKPSKILAKKGKSQIGAVTSAERGITTTCICCINAAGEYIPPMLIFKRKRMSDDLKRGGPPNTLYTCSDSGWIVSQLFLDWMLHFISCLRLQKSDKNQVLIILDGHATHTKNIEAIRLAREYGIILLSLPAHTTHKLQPLDRAFFKSLKSYYNQACSSWLRNNPGQVIKQSNVSEIFGQAYYSSVRMDSAIHGFESSGLWPCNRFKIRDDEFIVEDEPQNETRPLSEVNVTSAMSNVTPVILNTTPPTSKIIPSTSDMAASTSNIIASAISASTSTLSVIPSTLDMTPVTSDITISTFNVTPSTSKINTPALNPASDVPQQTSPVEFTSGSVLLKSSAEPPVIILSNIVLPSTSSVKSTIESISPVRKIGRSKITTATSATVLTESPYKNELERKIEIQKKKLPKIKIEVKTEKPKIKNKENIIISSKKPKHNEKETEAWLCLLCNEDRPENMIKCNECSKWVHELCAGADSTTYDYCCDNCK